MSNHIHPWQIFRTPNWKHRPILSATVDSRRHRTAIHDIERTQIAHMNATRAII